MVGLFSAEKTKTGILVLLCITLPTPSFTFTLSMMNVNVNIRSLIRTATAAAGARAPLTVALATDSRSLQRQRSFLKTSSGFESETFTPDFFSRDQVLRQNLSVLSTRRGMMEDAPAIQLTQEEEDLFELLTLVTSSLASTTTLRVAGGWVRDKLLATKPFARQGLSADCGKNGSVNRLTSKFAGGSKGRKGNAIINTNTLSDGQIQPLDIDIALDDMLGREFADLLNDYLLQHGRERVSVGMVLKNPEKSKHLETATMKVGKFWIDFVNLRAEEYAENSRIPDLMRIGTAEEDAFRRDLTINALFYNINKRQVEDFTGRGVDDLRRGVVATPLHPLTTLLDDPLRVLRSIRFAARLRFNMDESLRNAAKNVKVRQALDVKVSRERVGGEVDLMLRSPDPVGAMRLLVNLHLAGTVFRLDKDVLSSIPLKNGESDVFDEGLNLLSTTHDYLCDCKFSPPVWCQSKSAFKSVVYDNVHEIMLNDDEESRRVLWYSAFLKPLRDYHNTLEKITGETKHSRKQGKKAHRSLIMKLMLDELKRPTRDAEAVERIMKGADDFTRLINNGSSEAAINVLMNGVFVKPDPNPAANKVYCSMQKQNGELLEEVRIDSKSMDDDAIWKEAMEYRLRCAQVLRQVKSLWRASLILSLCEQLAELNFDLAIEEDVIGQSHEEVRLGVIAQYDAFAASLLQLGLIGIWTEKAIIDGEEMKKDHILPNIPKGPVFREIMMEQEVWMTLHPGCTKENLIEHMREKFPDFT